VHLVIVVEREGVCLLAKPDHFIFVDNAGHAAVFLLSIRDELKRVVAFKHAAHCAKGPDEPLPVAKRIVLHIVYLRYFFCHLSA
jgi:hypothetical protein